MEWNALRNVFSPFFSRNKPQVKGIKTVGNWIGIHVFMLM